MVFPAPSPGVRACHEPSCVSVPVHRQGPSAALTMGDGRGSSPNAMPRQRPRGEGGCGARLGTGPSGRWHWRCSRGQQGPSQLPLLLLPGCHLHVHRPTQRGDSSHWLPSLTLVGGGGRQPHAVGVEMELAKPARFAPWVLHLGRGVSAWRGDPLHSPFGGCEGAWQRLEGRRDQTSGTAVS